MGADTGTNRFGRTSRLELQAHEAGGRTQIGRLYFTAPLKVMRPFALAREELPGGAGGRAGGRAGAGGLADPVQVMVMSASAGFMEGDEQLIEVAVGPRAALQVTSQAFDKVHRMPGGGQAARTARLSVAAGGLLDYRPQALIPFAGSAFAGVTEVELADATAAFAYQEVLSCGRAARGERFAYRRFANRLTVRVGGRPVFRDKAVFEPATMDMEGVGLFEGYSHAATLLLVNGGVGDAAFRAARECLLVQTGAIGAGAAPGAGAGGPGEAAGPGGPDGLAGGITRLAGGDVAVRLLGNRAERLEDALALVRRALFR